MPLSRKDRVKILFSLDPFGCGGYGELHTSGQIIIPYLLLKQDWNRTHLQKEEKWVAKVMGLKS